MCRYERKTCAMENNANEHNVDVDLIVQRRTYMCCMNVQTLQHLLLAGGKCRHERRI